MFRASARHAAVVRGQLLAAGSRLSRMCGHRMGVDIASRCGVPAY